MTARLSQWLRWSGSDKQLVFLATTRRCWMGWICPTRKFAFAVERNNLGMTRVRPITITPELVA